MLKSENIQFLGFVTIVFFFKPSLQLGEAGAAEQLKVPFLNACRREVSISLQKPEVKCGEIVFTTALFRKASLSKITAKA